MIRFPIILSVYIVYIMHKVQRRMVKTNAMNTQGDKKQAILHNAYILIMWGIILLGKKKAIFDFEKCVYLF